MGTVSHSPESHRAHGLYQGTGCTMPTIRYTFSPAGALACDKPCRCTGTW